jgi:hypothetical protein
MSPKASLGESGARATEDGGLMRGWFELVALESTTSVVCIDMRANISPKLADDTLFGSLDGTEMHILAGQKRGSQPFRVFGRLNFRGRVGILMRCDWPDSTSHGSMVSLQQILTAHPLPSRSDDGHLTSRGSRSLYSIIFSARVR